MCLSVVLRKTYITYCPVENKVYVLHTPRSHTRACSVLLFCTYAFIRHDLSWKGIVYILHNVGDHLGYTRGLITLTETSSIRSTVPQSNAMYLPGCMLVLVWFVVIAYNHYIPRKGVDA